MHAPSPSRATASTQQRGAELMRLNSYLSWNSVTLSLMRPLEKFSTSASFSSSARRPSMRVRLMTSSPTAFIMRSSRSSAMRTDFDCAMPTGSAGRRPSPGGSSSVGSPTASAPRSPLLLGNALPELARELGSCAHRSAAPSSAAQLAIQRARAVGTRHRRGARRQQRQPASSWRSFGVRHSSQPCGCGGLRRLSAAGAIRSSRAISVRAASWKLASSSHCR